MQWEKAKERKAEKEVERGLNKSAEQMEGYLRIKEAQRNSSRSNHKVLLGKKKWKHYCNVSRTHNYDGMCYDDYSTSDGKTKKKKNHKNSEDDDDNDMITIILKN